MEVEGRSLDMIGELELENERLLQFLYACPVGLIELSADGTIGMVNPFAMQLLLPLAGTSFMENFFDVMNTYAPELRNLADGFPAPRGTVCENHRILVKPGNDPGDEKAMTLACTLVKLAQSRLFVALTDVSKQVLQEHRLKQAEVWFASLLDDVNDFAVMSLDAEGRIDAVNPSVLRHTGFSRAQLLGHTMDVFDMQVSTHERLGAADQISEARREGWYLHEGWQTRLGGERYWCQRLIAARSETERETGWDISGYTVVMREVTQQHFAIDQLTRMLTTDYLTGVCNRARFFEMGERECLRARRYSQPLALISIDLDHFKSVNDTHGHAAGDEALKAFVNACAPCLRPSDTLARLGGEEFAVLLPSSTLQGAGELAERLLDAVYAATVNVPGGVLRMTASFGCSELNQEVTNLKGMIAAADRALYRSKEGGRNRVTLALSDQSTVAVG